MAGLVGREADETDLVDGESVEEERHEDQTDWEARTPENCGSRGKRS